jgi:peptidyl-prolyl cis-trans isomerase D
MLQQFNERIKGVVAWVVVVLIAFTFVMFGLDYFVQSKQSSSAVAEVNGQAIPISLFEQMYQRIRHQDTPPSSVSQDNVVKKQILEDLIINTLSLQAANKVGFYVSPNQVTSAIMHIPQFQEGGKFSSARYQQVLSASMFTPATLQREVSQGMLINQQRFAFIGGAFVLPSEVERYAALLYETRDYTFTVVPMKEFMANIKISEADAHTYYQAHLQQFTTPERVSLNHMLLFLKKRFVNIIKTTWLATRWLRDGNYRIYCMPFQQGQPRNSKIKLSKKHKRHMRRLVKTQAYLMSGLKRSLTIVSQLNKMESCLG